MFKDFECGAVGQMDVHEYDIGRRIGLEPGDAVGDAVQRADDLRVGCHLREQGLQVADSGLFVLNNQCFHDAFSDSG